MWLVNVVVKSGYYILSILSMAVAFLISHPAQSLETLLMDVLRVPEQVDNGGFVGDWKAGLPSVQVFTAYDLGFGVTEPVLYLQCESGNCHDPVAFRSEKPDSFLSEFGGRKSYVSADFDQKVLTCSRDHRKAAGRDGRRQSCTLTSYSGMYNNEFVADLLVRGEENRSGYDTGEEATACDFLIIREHQFAYTRQIYFVSEQKKHALECPYPASGRDVFHVVVVDLSFQKNCTIEPPIESEPPDGMGFLVDSALIECSTKKKGEAPPWLSVIPHSESFDSNENNPDELGIAPNQGPGPGGGGGGKDNNGFQAEDEPPSLADWDDRRVRLFINYLRYLLASNKPLERQRGIALLTKFKNIFYTARHNSKINSGERDNITSLLARVLADEGASFPSRGSESEKLLTTGFRDLRASHRDEWFKRAEDVERFLQTAGGLHRPAWEEVYKKDGAR